VIEVIDSDRAKMMEAIERAGKSLAGKQGVGMLFYAGHGLQLDWRNYMVPVDAKLNSAADVPKQAVDIEAVMSVFKSSGNRMNIVVLDACRDNPFADGKTASGKGLAPLDAPTGTFLAYATAPGNVAADGAVGSKNGLYTGFLLQELQKPTARIEDVFKRVRFQVRKASDGAQIPWETTSLEDDFVFNSGIKKVVKLTDSEKDKEFNIEKAEWDKIKDSKSADPFFAFVQKYPNGLLTQSAMTAIDRFNKVKTVAVADKSGQIIRTGYADLVRVGDFGQFIRYDGYTKNEISRRDSEILSIKDGVSTFSNGVLFTAAGEFIKSGDGSTFDPPLPILPADGVAVGRKWTARVSQVLGSGPRKGEKGWTEMNGRILAYETVTVPAGTFKAYKIEQNTINMWGYRAKTTIWTDFEAGTRVKAEFEGRAQNGNADRWYEELATYKRGPRS
jgi:hypothetical protein